jgi:hypothetical protein
MGMGLAICHSIVMASANEPRETIFRFSVLVREEQAVVLVSMGDGCPSAQQS